MKAEVTFGFPVTMSAYPSVIFRFFFSSTFRNLKQMSICFQLETTIKGERKLRGRRLAPVTSLRGGCVHGLANLSKGPSLGS